MSNRIIVNTDGGARGNPGPAAIGVQIKPERGQKSYRVSQKIGQTTNNQAEYEALIVALNFLRENLQILGVSDETEIEINLDSSLVVNQVNGLFKMKNSALRERLYKIRELETQIPGKIYYKLVPREQNKEADFLVNQALDS